MCSDKDLTTVFICCRNVEKREKKPPTEEEMLKILTGADKAYVRICAKYGFTDFRGILKKLKEMKKNVDVEVGIE